MIAIFFIVEAAAKILALGFVIGKKTYLRDPFNVLDFIIAISALCNFILDRTTKTNINYVKALRALRALRPLRIVSRNEGMRNVVNSLITAIPSLFNVLLICLLFILVFAILGVQLFKGALGSCSDGLM